MTNQQLKATIQAALQAIAVGGPAGTLDELIAGLSKRGPSGTYHAGELARHRHDPQALSGDLSITLDLLERHPELLGQRGTVKLEWAVTGLVIQLISPNTGFVCETEPESIVVGDALHESARGTTERPR